MFVIDHLFAEADYDGLPLARAPRVVSRHDGGQLRADDRICGEAGGIGCRELITCFPAAVHLAAAGGTRVTLIMHNFYVNNSLSITETPGTASLSLIGHWE